MSALTYVRSPLESRREGALRHLGLAAAATVTAAIMAYLITAGLWPVAVALLVLLPGFVLVHRAPLAVISIWLLAVPLMLDIGGGVRYGFWALHRALPVGVLIVLIVAGMLGIRTQALSRLGWPEFMMVAYLIASALSVAYASDEVPTGMINLYDRVAIPMSLYLLVRLLRPAEDMFRYLVPAATVILVTQTIIGTLSWVAPALLPTGWLGRAGSRTTGSLSSPSVYGVTMIAAGLIVLHASAYEHRPHRRQALRLLFMVSLVMVLVTFTRGVWLGGLVALAGAAWAYPRQIRRLVFVALPLSALLVMTGSVGSQISTIETRFGSDQTALSRLPVVYASIQMFEAKPITGWGYGNFDKFDRDFQRQVNGFFPEKDHASHNLYLTIAAEQGTVGLVFFLGPALWWLVKSRSAYFRLPPSGLISRKLLILLWAILASHVVVNNFSDMSVVFGLGQWWLVLGLIAALVSDQTAQPSREPDLMAVSRGK